MSRFTYGIATASWIDKSVHFQLAIGPALPVGSLPVHDGTGPPPTINRSFFTACRGFRFANLLEVGVEIEDGKIVQAGFTPDSTGYFSDSFLGRPSHAYTPRRTMTRQGDQVVFTQIVGARTVGPEEAGGTIGAIVGGAGAIVGGTADAIVGGIIGWQAGRTAARAALPFAPIWSELEVQIGPDGNATGRLRRFSLFPSLTYYEQDTHPPNTPVTMLRQKNLPYGPSRYDAGQRSQGHWFEHGWGALRGGSLGPTPGNPWGVENDGTDRELNRVA